MALQGVSELTDDCGTKYTNIFIIMVITGLDNGLFIQHKAITCKLMI